MKDDRRKSITKALLEILQAIEAEGGEAREGRWSDGRTSVDYSVSMGGLADDNPFRSTDEATSPSVAVREYGDELVLVADIPEARAEDISVDLEEDGQMLQILDDGSVIGRVPLGDGPWRISDVSFNHNILEVRFVDD